MYLGALGGLLHTVYPIKVAVKNYTAELDPGIKSVKGSQLVHRIAMHGILSLLGGAVWHFVEGFDETPLVKVVSIVVVSGAIGATQLLGINNEIYPFDRSHYNELVTQATEEAGAHVDYDSDGGYGSDDNV